MSVETADRIADSFPKQVAKLFHQRIVKHLAVEDKEILDGLKKAGFQTHPGIDGTGWLFRKSPPAVHSIPTLTHKWRTSAQAATTSRPAKAPAAT